MINFKSERFEHQFNFTMAYLLHWKLNGYDVPTYIELWESALDLENAIEDPDRPQYQGTLEGEQWEACDCCLIDIQHEGLCDTCINLKG